MDAATAGVVGAAIGGGLALAGSIATGVFGLRQIRAQLKQQSQEAKYQRLFESLTERREPRQKAYADFIATCREAYELLNAVNQSDDDEFPRGPYSAIQAELRTQEANVAVMGPEDVASKADIALHAVITAKNYLVHGRPRNDQLAKVDMVRQAIRGFTTAARSALEGHGEPLPPA